MFLNIAQGGARVRSLPVFSPEFIGQRAQTISHGHAPYLECSDCHCQTVVAGVPLSTKLFTMFTYLEPKFK